MKPWWRQLLAVATRRVGTTRSKSCPLGACSTGARAAVLCMSCPARDADRLRSLGVFEGASVGIVDTRNGILLDVCGSRLALGMSVAMAITVEPLAR